MIRDTEKQAPADVAGACSVCQADFAPMGVAQRAEQLLALLRENDPQLLPGKTAADMERPEALEQICQEYNRVNVRLWETIGKLLVKGLLESDLFHMIFI